MHGVGVCKCSEQGVKPCSPLPNISNRCWKMREIPFNTNSLQNRKACDCSARNGTFCCFNPLRFLPSAASLKKECSQHAFFLRFLLYIIVNTNKPELFLRSFFFYTSRYCLLFYCLFASLAFTAS